MLLLHLQSCQPWILPPTYTHLSSITCNSRHTLMFSLSLHTHHTYLKMDLHVLKVDYLRIGHMGFRWVCYMESFLFNCLSCFTGGICPVTSAGSNPQHYTCVVLERSLEVSLVNQLLLYWVYKVLNLSVLSFCRVRCYWLVCPLNWMEVYVPT